MIVEVRRVITPGYAYIKGMSPSENMTGLWISSKCVFHFIHSVWQRPLSSMNIYWKLNTSWIFIFLQESWEHDHYLLICGSDWSCPGVISRREESSTRQNSVIKETCCVRASVCMYFCLCGCAVCVLAGLWWMDDTCEIEVTFSSETLKGSLHLQCTSLNTLESEIFKYIASAGVCVCLWVCVCLAEEQSSFTHLDTQRVSDLQRISRCLLLLHQMAKQNGSCNYSEFNLLRLPKYRL